MAKTLASTNAAVPQAAANRKRARETLRDAQPPPALEQLVADHRERVTRLCYRLLGWRNDIEDTVQEIFLAALRGLPGYRGQSKPATWLTRIAINTCRSRLRRRGSWLRLLSTTREEARPRGGESPARDAIKAERFDRVRQAVRRLSPKYREVVVLRYLEEMDVAEIAEVLQATRATVEVRLSRARKELRQDLMELLEQ